MKKISLLGLATVLLMMLSGCYAAETVDCENEDSHLAFSITYSSEEVMFYSVTDHDDVHEYNEDEIHDLIDEIKLLSGEEFTDKVETYIHDKELEGYICH